MRTWEEDGVRVFAAAGGAVIRQGDFRVAAPRVVVWFDRAESSRPEVRAATVRFYAEGAKVGGKGPAVPVRLVEGQNRRECGALFLHLQSRVSFIWDCPLERLDKAPPSPLLTRALGMTKGLTRDTLWTEAPAPTLPEVPTAVQEMLQAEQFQVFLPQSLGPAGERKPSGEAVPAGEEEALTTLVYSGDVRGTFGNLTLRADGAVLWYDMKTGSFEIYARGDVRLSRLPGTEVEEAEMPPPTLEREVINRVVRYISADELYINPRRGRSLAVRTELRLHDPKSPIDIVYVIRGDEAFQVDVNTLTITEASVTTSEFAHPPFQFKAQRAQVVFGENDTFISAWDVRFQAGREETTLLWVPFLGTDLSSQTYLLSDYAIGASSNFGLMVQTTWQPMDLFTRPAWVDRWTVNLDLYTSRGPAIGTELQYHFGGDPYPNSKGRVRAYYVYDNGDEDATGLPVPQKSRGRFHVEHRTQIDRDWRLDAELYYLSDSGFLREYFEADFEEEKQPESYLLARYLRNSTYLALLFKAQVNDFLTQVEQMPSADLQFMALPVGRLVYDGGVTAGIYDLEFNNELMPPPPDPPALGRVHTDHRVSLPFNAGIFRVDPFVRALATYVTDSSDGMGGFDGNESRVGVGAGFTLSTTLHRVFDKTSEKFELNRLRHIVIPYLTAEVLSTSGAGSEDFIQMDAIDQIDTSSEVRIGLRQRLQTKRRRFGEWRSVNWMKLDVAAVLRSSDSVAPFADQDYLWADFIMVLTDHITLHSRDDRFASDNTVVNLGARFDFLPEWALDLDFDYLQNRSSAFTAGLSYKLSDRYHLLAYEQYDFNSQGGGSDNLETQVVLRRFFDQWVLDLGFRIDNSNNNNMLVFGFGPKGFGALTNPRRAVRN